MKKFFKLAAVTALVIGAGVAVAAENSGTSEVTGQLVGSCSIAASNVAHGQIAVGTALAGASDKTSTLTVNCSSGVGYKVWLEPTAVPIEYTASAALGGGVNATTAAIAAGVLTLTNGGAPVGVLRYWQEAGKTTPFPQTLGTGLARTGTGADQTIDAVVEWDARGITPAEGSFAAWKVTNTYKVSF